MASQATKDLDKASYHLRVAANLIRPLGLIEPSNGLFKLADEFRAIATRHEEYLAEPARRRALAARRRAAPKKRSRR